MAGDLHVMEYAPVLPERTFIRVSFKRYSLPWEEDEDAIDVPVDRHGTARFDRFLAERVAPVESDGVRVQLTDLAAGLIRTAADIVIDTTDKNILAVVLGRLPSPVHVPAGPGPTNLWRDWHPPQQENVTRTVRREKGRGSVTITLSSGFTVQGRRMTQAEIAKQPPLRERPPDWRAWALPGREPLAIQGSSGRGGPVTDRPRIERTLYIDAPPQAAAAIELSFDQIWAFRYAGSRARIPAPQADRITQLAGTVLEGAGCRVELEEWADVGEAGYRLTARCDPAETSWPDLRIVTGPVSTSMWCEPPQEGRLTAVLPLNHAPLFEGPDLEIALRMVGHRVEPIRLTAPLTPPGDQA